VCVLGLGLIGGSLLRALKAAQRETFGYNRSIDGVQAARFDGFDASDSIGEVLTRAADTDALIVLAVPVPALPIMLDHISTTAPHCPLTDVVSVKGALLQLVSEYGLLDRYVGSHPMAGTAHSGWAAGSADLFVGAPWVLSVDDHVDAQVWADVMQVALDCRAFVVPARSDEHDAAVAAISHLPHLLAEALAATAFDVPLAFSLAAGSFRDGTRVAATSPDLVRAMCEANSEQLQVMLNRAIYALERARNGLSAHASVADLVETGHGARVSYDNFSRPDIVGVTIGADGWRATLAAEGRAGGVIRSALPVRGSRG
jgi:prephenate dehydrogenase